MGQIVFELYWDHAPKVRIRKTFAALLAESQYADLSKLPGAVFKVRQANMAHLTLRRLLKCSTMSRGYYTGTIFHRCIADFMIQFVTALVAEYAT